MATWQVTFEGTGPARPVSGVSDPVFVIQYGGKTYATVIVQEFLPGSGATFDYYQGKYDAAVQDPAAARRVNVIEAELVHPVNVDR